MEANGHSYLRWVILFVETEAFQFVNDSVFI